MVKGGYEQMPDVYGAVIAWVNENRYEPDVWSTLDKFLIVVETASLNESSAGLGRLKSGIGWISLDFVKRL